MFNLIMFNFLTYRVVVNNNKIIIHSTKLNKIAVLTNYDDFHERESVKRVH